MDEPESIGILIKKIHDAIGTVANVELKELNLTMSQSRTLCFLYQTRGGGVTVKEIENHFCIKHTTAIGILNRLEKKGFAQSYGSSDDKRVRIVEITKAGETLHETVLAKRRALQEKYLKSLSEAEVEKLRKSLLIINADLQELKLREF